MFGSTSTFNKPANKLIFGVFAGLALATQANAHLFIKYPAAPLEGPIKSPLDPSGSNFPCHGAQLPTTGGIKMAAGSSQLLQFDDGGGANTASHGGGSCQLSVYYDGDAKDPSNWKVIHSIEGGCPTNAAGNLPTAIQCSDPGADGVNCYNSYNFTMPGGVKSGHAIFAWTWFNTIGNREMYMNCVNAQIEGGDGSEMNELPSLFVANLAGASMPQCATSEQQSYKFPNPGKYVTSDTKGSPYKLALVSGGSCASDGAPAGGAAPGGAAPPYGGSAGSNKPPGGDNGGGNGSGQVTVTTMETKTSGGTPPTNAPAPPAYSAAPSGAAPAPSAPAPAPAPYASGSGSSSAGSATCPAGAQPCSNDGGIVCMGNQFGICNMGCAVAQPLAPGTSCTQTAGTDGKIAKRDHVLRHVGRKHGRHFA